MQALKIKPYLKNLGFVFIGLTLLFTNSGVVAALSSDDLDSIYKDTVWYNPSGDSLESCLLEGGTPVDASIIQATNELEPLYEQVAQKYSIPWQVLAGFHYRESTFNSTTNPDNGQGIFQLYTLVVDQRKYSFPPGPINEAEFLRQLDIATDYFLNSKAAGLQPEIQQGDAIAIKKAYNGYNGVAPSIQQQNIAEANAKGANIPIDQIWEGSSYVINKFDSPRMDMLMDVVDQGVLLGRDSRPGAFTVYAALLSSGGLSGFSSCFSKNAQGVVAVAKAELAKKITESAGTNCGTGIGKYWTGSDSESDIGTCSDAYKWCAAFVSWVFKKAGVPFTDGLSGGWMYAYVPTLKSYLESKHQYTTRQENKFLPQPGDLILFDNQGDEAGVLSHVEIIIAIDQTQKIITTIGGNTGNSVKQNTYSDYLNNNYVAGWGRYK